MILKLLRSNYTVQIFLFIITPLCLWIPTFITPPEIYIPEGSGPLYIFLSSPFLEYKLFSSCFAFIIVLFQGLFLNSILSKNGLVSKTSILPAILYSLCFCFDPLMHTFSPLLFLNILYLLMLDAFFKAYQSSSTFDAFFNACFCIMLCILIYIPAWPLILLIPITIIIYRLFVWRIWLLSLLGILAPCIALATFYFLSDTLLQKINNLFTLFTLLPEFQIKTDTLSIILSVAGIIFILINAKVAIDVNSEHVVAFKKKAQVLFYSFLLLLFISFYDIFLPVNLSFIAPFTAYSVTYTIYKKWKPFLIYAFLLLFVFIILIGNFQ